MTWDWEKWRSWGGRLPVGYGTQGWPHCVNTAQSARVPFSETPGWAHLDRQTHKPLSATVNMYAGRHGLHLHILVCVHVPNQCECVWDCITQCREGWVLLSLQATVSLNKAIVLACSWAHPARLPSCQPQVTQGGLMPLNVPILQLIPLLHILLSPENSLVIMLAGPFDYNTGFLSEQDSLIIRSWKSHLHGGWSTCHFIQWISLLVLYQFVHCHIKNYLLGNFVFPLGYAAWIRIILLSKIHVDHLEKKKQTKL